MQPFTSLTGLPAKLPLENVDTDLIIPKQFLKTLKRTGLGRHAFHDLRFEADGTEVPDFVLNQPAFRQAPILITGANFGCGSSREHAPWALLDQGLRCVIAPGFADIFFSNCCQNGILCATVSAEVHAALLAWEGPITVDLATQTLTLGDTQLPFSFPANRRQALLEGLDDIGQTKCRLPAVLAFEARQTAESPWLALPGAL